MTRVGLISDTHGPVEQSFLDFFSSCDEIWHCGDWGAEAAVEQLQNLAKVRGVYGNVDNRNIQMMFPAYQVFMIEDKRVLLTHIGAYPPRYRPEIRKLIEQRRPDLFLCGHSHILKVMHDPAYGLLHINPGAAGNSGFHKLKTAIRFELDAGDVRNMQILEVPRKRQ